MKAWILRSFRKGIITTKFPKEKNEAASPWSTIPVHVSGSKDPYCPTGAINDGTVKADLCISCGMCYPEFEPSMDIRGSVSKLSVPVLKRSIRLYHLDAGTCGACNLEVMALAGPHYDMARLGISFTNTPRHADALLVTGVLAPGMMEPLKKAFDAMAAPKVVFAIGACAISGSLLGKSISEVLNADVTVPGCPPDPFAIMDAIQKARGRQ